MQSYTGNSGCARHGVDVRVTRAAHLNVARLELLLRNQHRWALRARYVTLFELGARVDADDPPGAVIVDGCTLIDPPHR